MVIQTGERCGICGQQYPSDALQCPNCRHPDELTDEEQFLLDTFGIMTRLDPVRQAELDVRNRAVLEATQKPK